MNSLSVAVANLPIASLALTAELAEDALPLLPALAALPLLFLLLRVPTTTPTTRPTMTRTRSGIPNFIHLLTGFLDGLGLFKRPCLSSIWKMDCRSKELKRVTRSLKENQDRKLTTRQHGRETTQWREKRWHTQLMSSSMSLCSYMQDGRGWKSSPS